MHNCWKILQKESCNDSRESCQRNQNFTESVNREWDKMDFEKRKKKEKKEIHVDGGFLKKF